MRKNIFLFFIRVFVVTALLSKAFPLIAEQAEFNFLFAVKGYKPGVRFSDLAAVAIDLKTGLIYVADKGDGVIDAFSRQGIAKFQYDKENDISVPIGIAVDSQGNVSVSEDNSSIITFINKRGESNTLDIPFDKKLDPPRPGHMTFDNDGNLYVVEQANCLIYVFDKTLKFKFSFGGIGDKPGQFSRLIDVAVDRQGRIYAIDATGTPVQVFDKKGGFLFGFGNHDEGDNGFQLPSGIFIDQNDQLWVVDSELHSLKVFDRFGTFLRSFGNYGQAEGQFFHPIDACIDNLGRIYTLEAGTERMQVFSLAKPFEPFRPPLTTIFDN